MTEFLRISQLSKKYGAVQVLKGIDLHIQRGEFVSFLGPSGSGKTTLLRCIAGLEAPEGGSEIVLNDTIFFDKGRSLPPELRRLGMVFQNYAVWPHLNVFDNVAFPLKLRKLDASSLEKKVNEALNLVKMAHLKARFPHELSGGQQQRVALARALVMEPRLLLLDEPLSNLDALLREDLGAEIRKLQRELNLTTILVTHDQKEALSLSDRIVLLKDGCIDCVGTPETMYKTPPTEFAALFLAGGQQLQKKNGEQRVFLPRRWRIDAQGNLHGKVISKLYLGSEYEYWVQLDEFQEHVRMFHADNFSIQTPVRLQYHD